MTTEHVALLFTDVVGSTALSQSLSPEAADAGTPGPLRNSCAGPCHAGGTEVKNLGDGLMAVFRSASAALACGVAMQQAVERDNRGREHSVGSAGRPERRRGGPRGRRLLRGPGDRGGPPVRRLRPRADPGGRRGPADGGPAQPLDYRPLGELPLKGLRDPVVTVEVVWEPVAATGGGSGRSRCPGASPPAPAGVRVMGREPELSVLAEAAKRVTGERRTGGGARVGRGRPGQDHPGRRGRPRAPSTAGPASCSGTARRTSPPPTNSSRRPSATTSIHAHEDRLRGLVERPRVGMGAPGARARRPDSRPAAVEGHRSRLRALPALRRCRRAADRRSRARSRRRSSSTISSGPTVGAWLCSVT